MERFNKRTWAEINLDNAFYNFQSIKSKLNKKTKLMCVIKADAYGHGAEFLAKKYEDFGADWFGVSNVDEAMQLRKSGVLKPILIFGYTDPKMAKDLCKYSISQAVFSLDYALALKKECINQDSKLKIHIKIDTGMSRIGFFSQTPEFINKSVDEIIKISKFSEFEIEGIFTHFSVAEDAKNNQKYTLMQFDNFSRVIKNLENKNINVGIKHCCNSAGLINFPDMQLDMVRAGIILYGSYPSDELKEKIDLKPVMQLKTVVSQIKEVPKNTSVSYGRTFKSKKDVKIASVTIGYADGYSLAFSNKSQMLINGKRANVIGRVCMDQLMLDVSHIDDVKIGDTVTVFGKSGIETILAKELADIVGTIDYEIFCLIGKRVPRIYLENDVIIHKTNYLI